MESLHATTSLWRQHLLGNNLCAYLHEYMYVRKGPCDVLKSTDETLPVKFYGRMYHILLASLYHDAGKIYQRHGRVPAGRSLLYLLSVV